MKHLILFALLILVPVTASAKCEGTDLWQTLSPEGQDWVRQKLTTIPFSQGNHWIATKDDRVIHIVGTLHINEPRMDEIVDRLAPIIAKAEVLMLESTTEQLDLLPKEMSQNLDLLMIESGPTLLERMPAKDWAILSKLLRRQGIPPWMAAKIKPWFLGAMLDIPTCVRQVKEIKNGLDYCISAHAKKNNVAEVSLENAFDAVKLMDDFSLENQVKQLQAALPLYEQVDDIHATMIAGYFDEKVSRVLATVEYLLFETISLSDENHQLVWTDPLARLLDVRNQSWMPRIINQPGDVIIVAVGAAHLAGKNGVLNLLQLEGFELQRAQF